MRDPEQVRRLIAYNQWADERVLAAVAGMSAAELDRPRDAYFGSIADNLWHVLSTQRRWLSRWQGAPVRRPSVSSSSISSTMAPITGPRRGCLLERIGRSPGDFDYVLFLGLPSSSPQPHS